MSLDQCRLTGKHPTELSNQIDITILLPNTQVETVEDDVTANNIIHNKTAGNMSTRRFK